MRVRVLFLFVLLVVLFCGYANPFRDGYARNIQGVCMPLCGGGFTKLKASSDIFYPLFAQKNTSPSLAVGVDGDVCYADLTSGSCDAINIAYGDGVYHTNAFMGCPKSFRLSYNCGTDATGVPPAPREIEWGSLFFVDGKDGVCRRPSYVFGGWQADGKDYSPDKYYQYLTDGDMELTPVWKSVSYGIAYMCSTCDATYVTGSTSQYMSASSGAKITVSDTIPDGCDNATNAILTGFKIQYADGVDTGDTVAPGGTFTYKYDDNIRLAATWRENPPIYTLAYTCGDGATGTSPASRKVKYNKLFIAGADIGTCKKAGYVLSGWKIDDTEYLFGGYGIYSYNADKTLVAQWTPVSLQYGAAYVCNNGVANSEYLNVQYGAAITPSTTVCSAPNGKTFAGYAVQYADGTNTGDTVAPGASFTFNYDENIRLSAIWK